MEELFNGFGVNDGCVNHLNISHKNDKNTIFDVLNIDLYSKTQKAPDLSQGDELAGVSLLWIFGIIKIIFRKHRSNPTIYGRGMRFPRIFLDNTRK